MIAIGKNALINPAHVEFVSFVETEEGGMIVIRFVSGERRQFSGPEASATWAIIKKYQVCP